MSDKKRRLPIGIENFGDICKENFYYVDKTGMIQKLLNDWGRVNLFTRPRRFGKSLNMDMLKSFFEIGLDCSCFDGLAVSMDEELCRKHMGKYPVISLSLKDINGSDVESAVQSLEILISDEARRLCRKYDLSGSSRLLVNDKKRLSDIMEENFETRSHLVNSLKTLSQLLSIHCEKKVVLLIDEYDVPLDKAYEHGYYGQMSELIRSLFSAVLKSNEHLYFAVLTGCLRIAKESIFTGLNNFVVNSIADVEYAEYFGFTDGEVREMLRYYGMEDAYETIKEWYDGYRFGGTEVYCPWDVVNYLRALQSRRDAEPELYWINSSSNSIIRNLLENATQTTKNQLELLISGEVIEKKIIPELTYTDMENRDLDIRESYLWSVMYATGYLTEAEEMKNGLRRLRIPNYEIREIFKEKILGWINPR